MSWLQKLYETYEANVGRVVGGEREKPLLPMGHALQKAQVEIVLDHEGRFRRASVIEGIETLIPATEESSSRTSGEAAHALCDKIQYVAKDYGEGGFGGTKKKYFDGYFRRLTNWADEDGHPKLRSIRTYVEKGCVVKDLVEAGVLYLDPSTGQLAPVCPPGSNPPPIFRQIAKDANKKVDGRPIQDQGNAFVRWRVETPGVAASGTWEDSSLIESWTNWRERGEKTKGLCMVTGRNEQPIAESHPKGLRDGGDGAKLISSNDERGYTFRGRFEAANQAATVSSEATQKAHSALRWLISRQGHLHGKFVVLAWCVQGKSIPDPIDDSDWLYGGDTGDGVEEKQSGTAAKVGGDSGQAFARRLSKRIAGYRTALGSTDQIVVMGLDSATPGRMAVVYYRELGGSEFLDRVEAWHEKFSWWVRTQDGRLVVGAPAPKGIALMAYGRQLDEKQKLMRATVERILPCIVDGRQMPWDVVEKTVRRATQQGSAGRGDPRKERAWEELLGTACALYKGYHAERSYRMALEPERRSRDYLYGRLLAVAEHLEGRALWVSGEARDTTAARLMARFADRPFSTWLTIEKSLQPYKTRLRAKRPPFLATMEAALDQLHASFAPEEYTDDRPLSGEYLLGYHCQRMELRSGPTGSDTAEAETQEIGKEKQE